MANPDHLEILKRGVKKWNQWREDHPDIRPDFVEAILSKEDLSRANLSRADLSGAILTEADLTEVDLSKANLSGAILSGAILSGAVFTEAVLIGADLLDVNLSRAVLSGAVLLEAHLTSAVLTGAVLSGAFLTKAILNEADLSKTDLTGVDLSRADLISANLAEADLSGADLSGADLSGAILTRAILTKADLTEADLSHADLTGAILQNASLLVARLIDADLERANLTKARLWATHRVGWSIEGIICESVYWDEKGENLETYEPGEFERLFSEKTRVQIKYAGGISMLEIATLPGLIQHLESLHPGATLRFKSIQDASGGAVVNLVLDDADDISPEQIEGLRTAIQSEAERQAQQFRLALKEKEETVLRLEGQLQTFQWTFRELLSQYKPNQLLIMGGVEMGDKYEISGQAGAVGPNAHAHDMTFNQLQQIGSRIADSMDLAALASELETLRQALKKEASTEEHDIAIVDIGAAKRAAEAKDSGKLAESLKSAGKWALDVATKIGMSLATEAIKQSTGMK
jgi:uncharacterized protein YjbI with pentapeptide repeats